MWCKRYSLRIVAGLITFLAGAACYSYGSYYGGKIEAYLDVMRGAYSIRTYGTPDGWIIQSKDILSNEFGIDVVVVAGCIVSGELREKSRGYNDVMEAAIEERYGRGILERLWRRAQSEYQKKL
jgi:hypothetical protein